MHKLGISVHPEHSTPQHNQDYMESAAHYGFTRILAQSQILWEMPFEHMCLLLASKSLRKKYSSSWQPYPCLITVLILLLIPPHFSCRKGVISMGNDNLKMGDEHYPKPHELGGLSCLT